MTDARAIAIEKMRADGQPEEAIAVFAAYHQALATSMSGMLPSDQIEPVVDLPALTDVHYSQEQMDRALGATAIVKLNGGLGTSMGMAGPKSLVPVRDGKTFLDITVQQVQHARATSGAALPLVFMNSFSTREATLAALAQYPDVQVADLPLDFVQNACPKLHADTLAPIDWPADPHLEWCPPGHGDVFVALVASGILDSLIDRGFTYLFFSNSDNLGATPDARVAAWMAEHDLPFGMEVLERTRMDRKGGHLARRRADNQLILRERAMVPEPDMADFSDISKYRYFNSNSLWVSALTLKELLAANKGDLGLPMIVNRKTVDPRDKTSPAVIQIESAMGSAIEVFDGAAAIVVSRDRFRPVKTTNDLLLLRSDFYELKDSGELQAVVAAEAPFIDLDSQYFKMVDDFNARFPGPLPSLVAADSLHVVGDVTFAEPVVVTGKQSVQWLGPGQGAATMTSDGHITATAMTP